MFTQPDERLREPDEQLREPEDTVPTPRKFAKVIDTLVQRYHLSYFDAIMQLCDYEKREYDSIKGLITPKLKLALMEELANKKMLKDKNYLQHRLG